MDEVLILPDAVHHDVARERRQQGAWASVGRVARIDVRVHDPRPADESTGVQKPVRDTGKQAAQTPDAMLNRELAQPQWRGGRYASDARAAPRELEVESIDFLEDQPAVDFRHTVVIAALYPFGVREPDDRVRPQDPLGPQLRSSRRL